MRRRTGVRAGWVVGVAVALVAAGGCAGEDLGSSGTGRSVAHDVNGAGLIVGSVGGDPYNSTAVVVPPGGALTEIGRGAALGVNEAGMVVGRSGAHAFRWTSAGGMQLLGPAIDGNLEADDVNSSGLAVGSARLALTPPNDQISAPVFWRLFDVNYGLLPELTNYRSEAHAVNESGDIAGESRAADGFDHAVVWRAETHQLVDLGSPGQESTAYDIRDGIAVGYVGSGAARRAAVWIYSTVPRVLASGGHAAQARAIDRDGRIVGFTEAQVPGDGTVTQATRWDPPNYTPVALEPPRPQPYPFSTALAVAPGVAVGQASVTDGLHAVRYPLPPVGG